MESPREKMETSLTESPTKSGVEPSPQAESNVEESPSVTEAPNQDESSQEISSQAASSSAGGVQSQAAFSCLPSTSTEKADPIEALFGSSCLENGPAQKKQCIDYTDFKSMSSGIYLDATVVPILHIALITLDRLRPEDPVQFVIDFLLKNKADFTNKMNSAASSATSKQA